MLCAFSKIAAPLARTPSGMSQGQRLEHRAPLAARPMPLNLMCVAQHDSCNGFMHDYLLSNRAPGQHMTAACGVMRHAKQTCTPPMHLTRSSWRVQGLPPQDPRADGGAAAARLHEVMRRLLGQCTDRRAQAAALCGWACMPWAVARSARRGGAARSGHKDAPRCLERLARRADSIMKLQCMEVVSGTCGSQRMYTLGCLLRALYAAREARSPVPLRSLSPGNGAQGGRRVAGLLPEAVLWRPGRGPAHL